MEPVIPISLVSLYEQGILSARAYHLCTQRGISNIDALLRFYAEHKDFLVLKGIGPVSNQELLSLCETHRKNAGKSRSLPVSSAPHYLNSAYACLTPEEKQTYAAAVRRQIAKQGLRAQKVLQALCSPEYNTDRLLSVLTEAGFSFGHYRQVGVKTEKELEHFVGFLVQLTRDVKATGFTQEVHQLELDHTLEEMIKGCTPLFKAFLKAQLHAPAEKAFPIWKFLELFLLETRVLRPRTKRILLHSGKVIQPDTQNPFEPEPQDTAVSKQRVMQILKQETLDGLFWKPAATALRQLQTIHIAKNFDFFAGLQETVLFVDAHAENARHGTHFTNEFLTYGIARLSGRYSVYRGEKKGPPFLFKRTLDPAIDLQSLLFTLQIMLGRRIETATSIRREGLVRQFFRGNATDAALLAQLEEAVGHILEKVYGLVADAEGTIEVGRNTRKNVWEYIEAILRQAQKPLHVKEIAKRFAALGKKTNETSVRSNLLRFGSKFTLSGASTYGLKEWEEEGIILGGTIRSLIINYLEQQPEPCHIYNIFQHIQPHRNTNLRSIQGIMQLDVQKRFHNYGQYFYGLSDKNYTRTSFQNINRHWFREVKSELFKEGVPVTTADIVQFVAARFKVEPVQVQHLLALKQAQRKIAVAADKTVTLIPREEAHF